MLRMYSLMHLQHVWAKPMDAILEEPQSQQQQNSSSEGIIPPQITEGAFQEEPESFEELEPATAEAAKSGDLAPMEVPPSAIASDQEPVMLPSPPPSYDEEQEEQQEEMPAKEKPIAATTAVDASAVEVVVQGLHDPIDTDAETTTQDIQQEEEEEVIVPAPVPHVANQEVEVIPAPAVVTVAVTTKAEEVIPASVAAPTEAEQQEEEIIPVPALIADPVPAEQEEKEIIPAPVPAPVVVAVAIAEHDVQKQEVEEEVKEEKMTEIPTPAESAVPEALTLEKEPMIKPLPVEPPVHHEFLPKQSNKRDSKISTNSRDSIVFHEDGLKRTATIGTDRSFAGRARSFDEPEGGLPSIALSLKPSRSSQIQAKVATQRKRLSMKLKRAFSVSTKTN